MREILDRQMAKLKTQILDLGRLATEQVEASLQAVERRDARLARAVAGADGALDAAESVIDGVEIGRAHV